MLLFIYHPAAYLGGMLVAGIISVILGALIKIDMYAASRFYDPLLLTISPLVVFFLLVFRDGYYSDGFSPRFVALCSIPGFIAQHLCICFGYYGAVAIGSCQVLTYALFPHEQGNTAWELHLVLLGLQLLIQLPVFLLAHYCGDRRGLKAAEKADIRIMKGTANEENIDHYCGSSRCWENDGWTGID